MPLVAIAKLWTMSFPDRESVRCHTVRYPAVAIDVSPKNVGSLKLG